MKVSVRWGGSDMWNGSFWNVVEDEKRPQETKESKTGLEHELCWKLCGLPRLFQNGPVVDQRKGLGMARLVVSMIGMISARNGN